MQKSYLNHVLIHYIFALSPFTMPQYLLLVRARKLFPYLIMMRKTAEAAIPTKAADKKQF